MIFWQDWRFWTFIISLLSLAMTVSLGFLGRWVYVKIRFNDLKHLEASSADAAKILKKIDKRLYKIEKEVEKREALCNERHKK